MTGIECMVAKYSIFTSNDTIICLDVRHSPSLVVFDKGMPFNDHG